MFPEVVSVQECIQTVNDPLKKQIFIKRAWSHDPAFKHGVCEEKMFAVKIRSQLGTPRAGADSC